LQVAFLRENLSATDMNQEEVFSVSISDAVLDVTCGTSCEVPLVSQQS